MRRHRDPYHVGRDWTWPAALVCALIVVALIVVLAGVRFCIGCD